MYCSKCGAQLAEGAKFCSNCCNAISLAQAQPQKRVPISSLTAIN